MKNYKMTYDIHTHTVYSHGKGTIRDNVEKAVSIGLEKIGISDHGPGHLFYGLSKEKITEMRAEIELLQKEYKNIKIELGVEANIINRTGLLDVLPDEVNDYDYIMAGYHFGIFGDEPLFAIKTMIGNILTNNFKLRPSKKLINSNTDIIIKALHENDIKVLTHPGDKGPFDIKAIAEECVKTNTIFEINNKHNAPTEEELFETRNLDLKYIISSDAHKPEDVGSFEKALKRALNAKIDIERIVNIKLKE